MAWSNLKKDKSNPCIVSSIAESAIGYLELDCKIQQHTESAEGTLPISLIFAFDPRLYRDNVFEHDAFRYIMNNEWENLILSIQVN